MAKQRNNIQRVIPEKEYSQIEIERLVPADWNYKQDDLEMDEKLINNLKRNGQVENIIIRPLETGFFEVINGNHRLFAFKKLELPLVYVYNTGKISLEAAQRLAIETNETKYKTDVFKLGQLIKEISEQFPLTDLINTFPYDQSQLENFSKMTEGIDFNQVTDEQLNKFEGIGDIRTVLLKVNEDVYKNWLAWRERCTELLGYDSDAKCFEFAIVEAMNIPEESLLK